MPEQEIVYRIRVVSEDTGTLADITSKLAETNKLKAALNDEIKKGNTLSDVEKKQFTELTTQQKAYQQQIKAITSEIDKKVKAQQVDINSLAGMRAKMSEMRQEFEKLNPATAASKKLGASIADLQTKINAADFSTKNFRGNVGNYQNAIEGAIAQTGLMNSGVGSLVGSFGAGIPVIAGVGAAVGLLTQYFQSNENRADSLQVSMSVLSGALNDARAGVNGFIDSMAGGEGGLAGLITDVTRAIETQIGAYDALGKSYLRATVAEQADQISDNARAQQVENSALEKKISMLKLMAADQKISDERRASYLRQAQDVEDQIFKQRYAQAIQEFDIIKTKYAFEEHTQELNDAYYAAQVKLNLLEKENLDNKIRLTSKASGLEEKSLNDAKAKTAEIKKQVDGIQEYNNALELGLMSDVAGFNKGASADVANLEGADVSGIEIKDTPQMKLYKTNADYYLETEEGKKAGLLKRLQEGEIAEQEYADNIKKIDQEVMNSKLNSTQQALDGVMSMLDQESGAYKMLATASAMISTYQGAAAAVAPPPIGAGPLFGPLLAGVTILNGLMTVAKINGIGTSPKKKKAADGAYIDGPSHAAGGVPIEAEGGEVIINKRSTSMYLPQLDAINRAGGGRRLIAARGMYVPTMPDFGSNPTNTMQQQINEMFNKVTSIPVVVSERDITGTQRRVQVAERQGNV